MESACPTHRSWRLHGDAIVEEVAGWVARGDERALAELIERFWEPLTANAARMLGGYDEADDVVQSVFMGVWNRRRLRISERLSGAYLYRCARYEAIDEQRRRRTRREIASRHTEPQERAGAAALDETQAGELRSSIQRALADLPHRRREVAELARFHGLPSRELGEVMVTSPKTVANQMCAALSRLRRELAVYLTADHPVNRGGRTAR